MSLMFWNRTLLMSSLMRKEPCTPSDTCSLMPGKSPEVRWSTTWFTHTNASCMHSDTTVGIPVRWIDGRIVAVYLYCRFRHRRRRRRRCLLVALLWVRAGTTNGWHLRWGFEQILLWSCCVIFVCCCCCCCCCWFRCCCADDRTGTQIQACTRACGRPRREASTQL